MPPNNQMFNTPGTQQAPGAEASQILGSSNQTSKSSLPSKKNSSTTQGSLLLSEIRDNMVIMDDGSFRAVIKCESINFDLMSDREREGVEVGYQFFLNSLSHPVQILIRSRRVDIGPYLEKLYGIRQRQDNMLLNVLMDDYMNFIDLLAQEANIMAKSFYIVVPYNIAGDLTTIVEQSRGFFEKVFKSNRSVVTKIDKKTYQKAQDEIARRVDAVCQGLRQMQIQCRQLETKELSELYYNYYNPDTAVSEPLVDYSHLATTYVKKATDGSTPPSTEAFGV